MILATSLAVSSWAIGTQRMTPTIMYNLAALDKNSNQHIPGFYSKMCQRHNRNEKHVVNLGKESIY